MMQIERRIPAAGKRIQTHASHGEVASSVHAGYSLKIRIKAAEIVAAVDNGLHVRRLGMVTPERRQVSLQAPRIIIEAIVPVLGPEGDGAQVDGVVGKGTRVDAAAAGAGRDGEVEAEGGDVGGAVGDGSAVAAHGGWGAVEDGGLAGVLPGEGPVPVGLGAGVAAFFLERFLVEPGEVAVEVEE